MVRNLGSEWAAPFAHNDYLDLRRHPDLVAALRAALDAGVPAASTGSRLLSGGHPAFADLEGDVASTTGCERALFLGSASEANRAAVTALVGRHDAVVLDELAHASLWDGAVQSQARRDRFRHNDPGSLREVLRSLPATRTRLVLVESVYSMDGDAAPLAELLAVCEQEDALLLVDEAHGAGIHGDLRCGLSEPLSKDGALVAVVLGCGKALASSGGLLCGPAALLDEIANTTRSFIFTTAPSPLSAVAARAALEISRREPQRRERLFDLSGRFASGLRALGFTVPERPVPGAIFPIPVPGAEAALLAARKLGERGFHLRAIRPPTVPAGTERLRATLSADLPVPALDTLLAALAEIRTER